MTVEIIKAALLQRSPGRSIVDLLHEVIAADRAYWSVDDAACRRRDADIRTQQVAVKQLDVLLSEKRVKDIDRRQPPARTRGFLIESFPSRAGDHAWQFGESVP